MANQATMERDLLSCSICLDLLKEPKTLACMHRFCESCLSGHIVASTARTSSTRPGFACPVCREFIPAPIFYPLSTPPSAWASLFKTDFMVKGMVEVYQSKQDVHLPKVNNPCPKHTDKEQELYCFDHSAIACHLCAVISHGGCDKIGTLKDAAQQRRAIWQTSKQQMQSLIREAVEIETLKERYMKEITTKKASVENKIKETANKMREIVTREEKKLLKKVQKNYDDLQQNALKFTEKITNIKSIERNVSSKFSSSSDFDLMADEDVTKTMDSRKNRAINKDYRRFCEALPFVEWRFQPQNNADAHLGHIEFMGNAATLNRSKSTFSIVEANFGYREGKRLVKKIPIIEQTRYHNVCCGYKYVYEDEEKDESDFLDYED